MIRQLTAMVAAAVLLTAASASAQEGFPHLPDRVNLVAESCNLWKKEGTWRDPEAPEDAAPLVHWEQRCSSVSPADVVFFDSGDRHARSLGRTDQKLASITVKIRLRDAHDNVTAWLEEEVTWRSLLSRNAFTQYRLTDGRDTALLLGLSSKEEILSTTITFYDPSGATVLAVGRQSVINKVARSICQDGVWTVTFTAAPQPQRLRQLILQSLTVKAVRDTDRTSEGEVRASSCQQAHWWIALLGLGVGGLLVVGLLVTARYFFSQARCAQRRS